MAKPDKLTQRQALNIAGRKLERAGDYCAMQNLEKRIGGVLLPAAAYQGGMLDKNWGVGKVFANKGDGWNFHDYVESLYAGGGAIYDLRQLKAWELAMFYDYNGGFISGVCGDFGDPKAFVADVLEAMGADPLSDPDDAAREAGMTPEQYSTILQAVKNTIIMQHRKYRPAHERKEQLVAQLANVPEVGEDGLPLNTRTLTRWLVKQLRASDVKLKPKELWERIAEMRPEGLDIFGDLLRHDEVEIGYDSFRTAVARARKLVG